MANENTTNEEEIKSIAEKLINNRVYRDRENLNSEISQYQPQVAKKILLEAIKIGIKKESGIELDQFETAIEPKTLQKIYSEVLNDYALGNNDNLIEIAKKANSTILMEVVKLHIDPTNTAAITRALGVCSDDVVKEVILGFAKDKNNEAIELLEKYCKPELFKKACHEALIDFATNKNTELKTLVAFASLTTFNNVMAGFIEKGNKKAVQKIEKSCTREALKEVYSNALHHFVSSEKYSMQSIAEKASVNAFANALKECTLKKDKDGLSRLLMACPNENKQKAIFEMVMNTFLIKPEEKENFQFLSENCPAKFKNEVLDEVENPSILTKLKRLGKKVKKRSAARRRQSNNNTGRNNTTRRM